MWAPDMERMCDSQRQQEKQVADTVLSLEQSWGSGPLCLPPPLWAHPRSPLHSALGTALSGQGQLCNNLDIECAPHSLSGVMILGSHSCSEGYKAPAQWSEQKR